MRRTTAVRVLRASAAAAALTSTMFAASAATPSANVMPDGSIRYVYGRRPAPSLVCAPRSVCDIALDGGESVLNMAIGDAAHRVIAGGQSGPSGSIPHVFASAAVNFRVVGTQYIVEGMEPNYDLVLAASTERHGRPERRASIRHL